MKTHSLPQRRVAIRSGVRHQKGAALLVALILLVLMTLLGLTAMRSMTLEERMAGNTFDRSLSFQAAEAALKEAEATITTATDKPGAGEACDNSTGVCGMTENLWNSSSTTWKSASALSNGSISITPKYIIEYLGGEFPCFPFDITNKDETNKCHRYRVTAQADPGDGRSRVLLQSIYAVGN